MGVLPCAIVGATLMVDTIRQVLADPAFKTTSPEASEAQHAAERLSVWVENESNHDTFERFSTAVYEDLGGLFTDGTVRSRPTLSPNREKMWRNLFCFDLLRDSLCDGRSSLKQPKHQLPLFFPTCN